MAIGKLLLTIEIPGCTSLKEKRSSIRPLIHRLQREFSLSVCEFDLQGVKTMTMIGCSMINSNRIIIEQVFAKVPIFIEKYFRELQILENSTEYF